MLAAARLEGGSFVPVSLTGLGPGTELAAWATMSRDGKVMIAIEDCSTAGRPQRLSILARGYTAGEQMLAGTSVEARSGILLGGASVTRAGRWRPKAARLERTGPYFRVLLRPASVAIVTLRRRRARHR